MGIFISAGKTVECVLIAVFFACFLTLISVKSLGILQSCGYSLKAFFGWAKRKNNMAQCRLNLLAFACVLSCAVLSLCFSFLGGWGAVIGLAAYVIFFVLYAYADNARALRVSFSLTGRFKRLLATMWLISALLCYIAVTLLNFGDYVWGAKLFSVLKYCTLAVFPLALLLIIALANLITLIWEKPINASYVRKAKQKLAASSVKIIGITGSYGKTSVKEILCGVLSQKYNVIATPKSYNTPLGLARTINGNDLEGCDFLIAEMGAKRVGDIAELCAICPPDYSLITGICPQHLESFKTIENIISCKGEIIPATKNFCVLSGDCAEYFGDIAGDKRVSDCVSCVKATCDGTKFTLTLGGESATVKTKLLGEHSAKNIGLCAFVACELGVPFADICAAIEKLDFVEHRLQLIKSNGVNILDDGYNANIAGAEAALNVLKSFEGRKICVTPGIVELGVLEKSENKELGKKLAGLDFVILVGETLVTAVKAGYTENGGDTEKLAIVPALPFAQEKLKEIIKAGDAVLFLNDLPERYL